MKEETAQKYERLAAEVRSTHAEMADMVIQLQYNMVPPEEAYAATERVRLKLESLLEQVRECKKEIEDAQNQQAKVRPPEDGTGSLSGRAAGQHTEED